MKKLICLLLILFGSFAQAQNLDEIIKKHIDAVGGLDSWNKLKSLRMECSMIQGGGEIKITFSQIDKVSMRQDIEAVGMKGYSIITMKEGWSFMPFQGQTKPEAMTADELQVAQDDLGIKDEFITYKELGKKIEFLGKDDFEGMECYKIKMTDPHGQETTYYLDTDSYYVIKQVDKITANGKEMENTTTFSNLKNYLKESFIQWLFQVVGVRLTW